MRSQALCSRFSTSPAPRSSPKADASAGLLPSRLRSHGAGTTCGPGRSVSCCSRSSTYLCTSVGGGRHGVRLPGLPDGGVDMRSARGVRRGRRPSQRERSTLGGLNRPSHGHVAAARVNAERCISWASQIGASTRQRCASQRLRCATVRRASDQAMKALRSRGEVTDSPRRRARMCATYQCGAAASSIATGTGSGISAGLLPLPITWRVRWPRSVPMSSMLTWHASLTRRPRSPSG